MEFIFSAEILGLALNALSVTFNIWKIRQNLSEPSFQVLPMLWLWLLLPALRLHALDATNKTKPKILHSDQNPSGKDRTLALNTPREPWGHALNPPKDPWALGHEAPQPGQFGSTCDFEAYSSDNITVGTHRFNEPQD